MSITVAHASGSERCVFDFVAISSSSFRVSASVFSVKFREIPWLFFCFCFFFLPWQMLILNSVAHASGFERQLSSIIFDL
jgi:hypothetical protein